MNQTEVEVIERLIYISARQLQQQVLIGNILLYGFLSLLIFIGVFILYYIWRIEK